MQDRQASDAAETAPQGAGTTAHTLVEHPVSHDQQASEAANEHRPHEGETAAHLADAALRDIAVRVEQLEKLPEDLRQLVDRVATLESSVAGAVDSLAQFEQKLSSSDAIKVAEELAALKKRLAGFIH